MRSRGTIFILLAFLLVTALPAWAQRADDSGRVSKNGKAEATIDGVQVTLEYGRPKVNGRTIWGGLVPYDAVWRTGANEATTISFSEDVAVEGKSIEAGKYGLFTIPGEGEWTFIFNKNAKQWGAFTYKEAEDALRVTVKPEAADHVEEMDFEVGDGKVVLRWEKLAVPLKVAAAP